MELCDGVSGAAVRLRGKRVGLVANQTAVLPGMRHLVGVLREAEGVELTALFAPEHGFYGEMDREIASGTDPRTGLTVFSLYGAQRKPSREMLAGVDALVFSIQDVGVRFYTYISTMFHCMEAAGELDFVVVDRPNPITGVRLEGNVSEAAFSSFVAVRPLPIRHGMTIGELAGMFNEVYGLGVELTVARMERWERGAWFDQTDAAWVMPSPAMPNLETAVVYPGTCLFEGMNFSLGRGTSRPFELIGAPWMDAFSLADAMNGLELPGVFFRPAYFVPTIRTCAGERCAGVQVHVMDREAFEPVRTAMHLLAQIRALYGDALDLGDPGRMDRKFGTDRVRKQVEAGVGAEEIVAGWEEERRAFERVREGFLIY